MQSLALFIIAVIGLFAVRYTINILKKWRAHALASKLHSCKPIRRWPHKNPVFGLDRISWMKKAMKHGNAQTVARQDFEAHGKTYQTCVMGTKTIYTMEWENIHAVQSTDFDKWGVNPLRGSISAMMGNGITVSDGLNWSHARKTLRPVFEKSQFKNLEEKGFEKHFARMLHRIPKDGSTVDLQKLLQRMTRFSGLDNTSPEADTFVADYNSAVQIVARMRALDRNLPFDIFGTERALQKAVAKLRPYVDKRIEAALKKKEAGQQSDGSYIFVDQLVYESEDKNFIRDQLLNVFFPARDASSAGASFIFFILARQPEVWKKLRNEVLDIEQPLKSRYLHNVINECLRLLAPANRALRTCIKDVVLPRGGGQDGLSPVYVHAGTHIALDFGQLHKDKDIWGEDALVFRPERWDNLPPMAKYQPFFAGPRKCPAQQMLLTQYAYLLVRMAKLFERIDNKDPVLEFIEEHNMTITSRNGVKVALISIIYS